MLKPADSRDLNSMGLSSAEAEWLTAVRKGGFPAESSTETPGESSRSRMTWILIGALAYAFYKWSSVYAAILLNDLGLYSSTSPVPDELRIGYWLKTAAGLACMGVLVAALARGRLRWLVDAAASRYGSPWRFARDFSVCAVVLFGAIQWFWYFMYRMHAMDGEIMGAQLNLLRQMFFRNTMELLPDLFFAGALLRLYAPQPKTADNTSATPFQLEGAIQNWRHRLAGTEAVRDDDTEELTEHLRGEIAHLLAAGLPEQEAFAIAQRRLGSADALAGEFAKVNEPWIWQTRAYALLLGAGLTVALRSIDDGFFGAFVPLAWNAWPGHNLPAEGIRDTAYIRYMPFALEACAHMAYWTTLFFIFTRLASGAGRATAWLRRHYARRFASLVDAGGIMLLLILSEIVKYRFFFHVGINASFGVRLLFIFNFENVSVLAACCIGAYLLHPSRNAQSKGI